MVWLEQIDVKLIQRWTTALRLEALKRRRRDAAPQGQRKSLKCYGLRGSMAEAPTAGSASGSPFKFTVSASAAAST